MANTSRGIALLPPQDQSADLMNDPQYATNLGGGEDGTGDADTCRICRGEATEQEPLFYPCKCSGSIKFVHQDCLMEWLSHSQKKHCELCKTPFRFTKLYSPNMPQTLPTHVFARHLIIHTAKNVGIWLRGCLVVFVWLGVLPWLMRHIWGALFWIGDGGWSSKNTNDTISISANEALLLAHGHLFSLFPNGTSPASPILATPTSSPIGKTIVDNLPSFIKPLSQTLNMSSTDPLTSSFFKAIYYGLGLNEIIPQGDTAGLSNASRNTDIGRISTPESSLLSDVQFLKTLTRYPKFNSILITTLEGQIITIVVVVCFVLIFLIREWVVQQQPGINMGAGFNAEFVAGERGARNRNILPENAPDVDGIPVERAIMLEGADRQAGDVAGRPMARPRRRVVRFEEERGNVQEPVGGNLVPTAESTNDSQGQISGETLNTILAAQTRPEPSHTSSHPSTDAESSKTHIDASEFISVWRRADGNPEEVLKIIEAEDLGEKLRYWKLALGERKRLADLAQTSDADDHASTHGGSSPSHDSLAVQPSEDNSSSNDGWVDLPDTPSVFDIHGEATSFQTESETGPFEIRKGKEKEVTPEVPLEPLFDMGEQRSEHPSDLPGLSHDDLSFHPGRGRPRAISDGPALQESSLHLGNNSWSFSDLASDTPSTIRRQESGMSQESWKAAQDRRVQQVVLKAREAQSQLQAQKDGKTSSSTNGSIGEASTDTKDARSSFEIYNAETGTTLAADSWDDVFAQNPVLTPPEEARDDSLPEENWELNPFHPDGLLPDDAHLLETRQPAVLPLQENPGLMGTIADWLWGDTNVVRDAPALDDEHIVHDLAAEAPFVPVIHNGADILDEDIDDEVPNRDRDRELAEALAAGIDPNDPDAMDDAEDFEGIMELVGMRGPLTALVQNGLFSAVLISMTLAFGVWIPYNAGRLSLLLVANPIPAIKMPLKLLFSCAAVLQDLTLVVLGCISYGFIQLGAFLKSSVSYTVSGPDITRTGVSTWSGAAMECAKVANSALDRITIMFYNTLVKIPESEVPAFSAGSHEALLYIKTTTFKTFQYLGVLITALVGSPAGNITISGLSVNSSSVKKTALALVQKGWEDLTIFTSYLASPDSWVMTLEMPERASPLDPHLSHWGGMDRFWAILAGYIAFSFLGAAYLGRGRPFSTSQTGREWEATIIDILNQAGGVMKVILIISIEMLVFPLYCGLLLDIALLPLFEKATILSRIIFTTETPLTSIFVHWFVGTCYMFHFALFVSMCRKIMRPGVLYFIRDPDDPTFHPVRDVLERNVATQLRKITFSAMVYGALVIVCLGGVVWSLAFAFNGVLPIHWSSNEPVLQFPIDLLFYNFFMPLAVKFFKPSDGLHSMYSWWFRKCARMLRLTWFLFGKQMPDEEGHYNHTTWSRVFSRFREGFVELFQKDEEEVVREIDAESEPDFERDGKYVRTPASDQVRIPKGQQVFIDVDEDDNRINGGQATSENMELWNGDMYKMVYIPPHFRSRIFLFIVFIWLFAAITGVGITVVPLVFGRHVFAKVIPSHVRKNDVYAFAIGSYILGSVLYCLLHVRQGYEYVRTLFAVNENTPDRLLRKISGTGLHVLRLIYAYTAFAIILPTLLTLAVEFYIIVPLHTYFSPSEPHVIHFVQSWTLGLLYVKIGTRLILWHADSRPAEALRAVTRNGYLNPDIRIATRAFIFPAVVILAVALTAPVVLGAIANSMALFGTDPEQHKMVYRYSYPFCMSMLIILMAGWVLLGVMKGWRMKIRDEVYLIGERLHNFGDRSKSGAGTLIPTGSRIDT